MVAALMESVAEPLVLEALHSEPRSRKAGERLPVWFRLGE
jgi:hypothetical protein